MKFKSGVYTEVSGSIGGLVYAHNRGGMYARAKGTPTNPNSPLQAATRAGFSIIAGFWSIISEAQRASWQNYAELTPVVDQFGDSRTLSGQQMMMRLNLFAKACGLGGNFTAPNTGGASLMNPVEITAAGGAFSATFTNTDAFAVEDGGALLIQMSRQHNPGTNFFKGPWRTAQIVLGDSTTAPTSPVVLTSPFAETPQIGQRVWIRARSRDSQGRLSEAQIHQTLVVA